MCDHVSRGPKQSVSTTSQSSRSKDSGRRTPRTRPASRVSPRHRRVGSANPQTPNTSVSNMTAPSPISTPLHRSLWRVSKTFSRVRHFEDLKEGDDIRFLVERMREYYQEFIAADIDSYWHRKSGQIVLAVLLVRYNGELRYTRGINSELSLPSGSTCAERSAISTALSSYLGISRSDFVAIAVLGPAAEPPNPVNPCGVCDEWIKKFEEVSPSFTVVTFLSTDMDLFLERCPLTFVEETMDDVPLHLRGNWSCRCGFHLNDAKQAYCSCCKQPRFKFRQHLQQQRLKVLEGISRVNELEGSGAHLIGTLPQLFARENTLVLQETEEGDNESASPHCALLSGGISQSTATEADAEQAAWNICTRKHKTSIDSSVPQIPCVVQHLAVVANLSLEVTAKTIRDLLSLKFIGKKKRQGGTNSARCDCSAYSVTQLGRDFLSVTTLSA